ncbi:MAG: CoA transferase [Nitrospinota bacterium]|nr:MAG: CoA transferase [Nitrospinota bacterium]
MPRALEGIRVLDFTEVLAGPFCAMLLGDMGADVIKVERPGRGDGVRGNDPFVQGESYPFTMVNRNKRSITINLKHPRSREILEPLIRQADIFIENFRPGTMERLGLGYDAVSALNPRIIYCSISGFGQTGPYRQRGGFDLIAQAMGGLMSVTGEPGGPPTKAGYPVADLGTAMFGVYGILSALYAREKTGVGQHIDVSLFETTIAWSVWHAARYFGSGEIPGPLGSAHPLNAPYQAFQTRDSYIVIAAITQEMWEKLCRLLEREDLITDPRFREANDRLRNIQVLAPILQERFLTRTAEEWLAELTRLGIPCGPINTLDKVFADPQARARGMVAELDQPLAGKIPTVGFAAKLSRTPAQIWRHAPLLGEHTREILLSLGYSEEQIAELEKEQVI